MNEHEIRSKIERFRERYRALEEWCDLEGALLNCDAAEARLNLVVAMDADQSRDDIERAMTELSRADMAIWVRNIEKDIAARKVDRLNARVAKGMRDIQEMVEAGEKP